MPNVKYPTHGVGRLTDLLKSRANNLSKPKIIDPCLTRELQRLKSLLLQLTIINRLGSAKPVYAIHRSDLTMGFNIN